MQQRLHKTSQYVIVKHLKYLNIKVELQRPHLLPFHSINTSQLN